MEVNFKIEIGNKAFELTETEARELYNSLRTHFDYNRTNTQPFIQPYNPPNINPFVQPLGPWGTGIIGGTVSNTTGESV
jgi:hypothetical protein